MKAQILNLAEPARDIVADALAAFWEVVVRRFPQARTGDLSIDREIALRVAAEAAVEEWISNNVRFR